MNTEEKDTEIEMAGEEETELTETEPTGESEEYELTYDEEGNIVIAEEAEEADGEEAEGTDAEGDEEPEASEEPEETEEPEEDTESEKDARIAELEAKLARITKSGKAALAKLGVKDTEDFIDGLETLAAETDGKTLDQYRKERRDTEEAEEAKAFLKKQAFENLKKADLAALHAAYPETAGLDDVEKMENFRRFAELRDKGLSVKEAYAAANPEAMRKSAAERGKRLAGTKAHIKSAAPKGAAGESTDMPPREMARWREMFPGYTDKQIKELFKRANS